MKVGTIMYKSLKFCICPTILSIFLLSLMVISCGEDASLSDVSDTDGGQGNDQQQDGGQGNDQQQDGGLENDQQQDGGLEIDQPTDTDSHKSQQKICCQQCLEGLNTDPSGKGPDAITCINYRDKLSWDGNPLFTEECLLFFNKNSQVTAGQCMLESP